MQQKNNPYSDLKILCHPDKVKAIMNGERISPLYVRIKPTNVCNQNCSYCVYANDTVIENRKVNRRESIPWEKMQEIISDLSQMGTKAITFSGGGEPLCYSHICETLDLVRTAGIDYAMITNGQALDQRVAEALKEAKWVRISLDSADAETYRKIRKVDTFPVVIDNIGRFVNVKNKECVLGVNFVVTKDNYSSIYRICRILSEIGVDNVKFSPLMVKEAIPQYHRMIREVVEEQIERAKKDFEGKEFLIIDKYTADESLEQNYEKQYSCCYIKEIFTVIGADSKVYYCHQRAYTEQGLVGDISEKSFRELWFSDETTIKFRNLDAKKECNFRCVFDERNQLLDSMVHIDKRHINFI